MENTAAKPRLRICVVSWNAKDDLRRCLTCAADATARPETVEIVVVDNGSTDGAADMVAVEFPDVRLIRSPVNLGFSAGNNVALADLDAPCALLLNSDAFLHPGSLDTLLDFADSRSDAGFIGPRVLNPDGSLQYSCRRFPTFAAGLFRNVYLGRLFPGNRPASDYLMQDFDHKTVREVDWLSGCALLVTRQCIETIGLLDAKTFFMYCEDMDWCLRARDQGLAVLYFPGATVTHVIGKSSDRAGDRMIREHHRSMWRFFRKHRQFFHEREPLAVAPLVGLGILLRVMVRLLRRRLINPLFGLGKQRET